MKLDPSKEKPDGASDSNEQLAVRNTCSVQVWYVQYSCPEHKSPMFKSGRKSGIKILVAPDRHTAIPPYLRPE